MILNVLRAHKVRFGAKYGRMVLCCDSKHYWRKDTFKYYKANRKKDRDASGFDFNLIFDTFDKIKAELKEFFPYQVIEVFGSEGDDVIGVIARKYHQSEKILVLSGDKDLRQLQRYPNIDQYAPIQAEWIKPQDTPAKDLKIFIMKGDRGDGIPNFLSPDDCFVKERRQTPLTARRLAEYVEMEPEKFCTTLQLRGYKRNETLIDLTNIPPELQSKILDAFDEPYNQSKRHILKYLVEHNLRQHIENLTDF